jgi:putative membrane protein
MLTKKLPIKVIIGFSIFPVILITLWSSLVVGTFYWFNFNWLAISFLPVSLLGIAVSFYVGFKNNVSYERQNDARKNWAAISYDTRAFVAMLSTYLPNEANSLKANILKRHIAWLYTHKSFLRHTRMDWEHDLKINNFYRKKIQQTFSISTDLKKDVGAYLSDDEINEVLKSPNKASSLLHKQSTIIKQLREKNLIEDFRMFELQNHITKFFEHQAQNERIKTFPVPRQYENFAQIFMFVFFLLLPLGMLNEMLKINI